MKTLTITLMILLSFTLQGFAASGEGEKKDKTKSKKEIQLKRSLDKQVSKHIFYPTMSEEKIEGSADVMFQIYPDGDVRVVMIHTKNPLIRKFIEKQAEKMQVDKESVVIGEVFRYRFSFKTSN